MLTSQTRRPGSDPVFQHIRAFQRGTKISRGSVAGLRTDPRPACSSAFGRPR